MTAGTSYTHLRGNLARTLDRVVDDQEVVIVRRKSARDVALVPATELAGLMETAHLLRSPRNARRLLAALRRAERGGGMRSSVDVLRRRVGDGRKSRHDAVFQPEFLQDLRYWVKQDRPVDLVEAVIRDPFQGIGKPEPLRYALAGCGSRRITQEHRLVYRVTKDRLDFLQARYHY